MPNSELKLVSGSGDSDEIEKVDSERGAGGPIANAAAEGMAAKPEGSEDFEAKGTGEEESIEAVRLSDCCDESAAASKLQKQRVR